MVGLTERLQQLKRATSRESVGLIADSYLNKESPTDANVKSQKNLKVKGQADVQGSLQQLVRVGEADKNRSVQQFGNQYQIGHKQQTQKLLESIGRHRAKDELGDSQTAATLVGERMSRDGFNSQVASLRKTGSSIFVRAGDSPNHRRLLVHSNQQSNSKIATLDAFNSSRRNSSRQREPSGIANEPRPSNECPTAKRRLHIKEKASVTSEAGGYADKRLETVVRQLREHMQAQEDRIRELEREVGELRSRVGISKK